MDEKKGIDPLGPDAAYDVGGSWKAEPIQYAGKPGVALTFLTADGSPGVEILLHVLRASRMCGDILSAGLEAEKGVGATREVPGREGWRPS